MTQSGILSIPHQAHSCFLEIESKSLFIMAEEKRYLTDLHDRLENIAIRIRGLKSYDVANDEKISRIVQEAVDVEDVLRKQYKVGVRFNIIRHQLANLKESIARVLHPDNNAMPVVEQRFAGQVADDERLVYVYLFNTQGGVLKTWQNLLSKRSLIEHSFNRPIYESKEQIDAAMSLRSMSAQHAYITIIVKKDDISRTYNGNELKDVQGLPIVRLRQGALKMGNIINFTHMGKEYRISPEGQLLLELGC
ncbi:MAG: hypothetical protein A3H43_05590 [Gammaproteobacteria bacterium RIFCSPLOWO2_02_FULL_42_9]|nr:MAG: hypothetical protein A3H43_05590 [Gammaproteobacteria bacterium RIFCSPLOWO2_02_FULL_42_9]